MRVASLVRPCTVAFTLVLWTVPPASAQQYEDLLQRIPGDANAIVLIDVTGVHNSPLAIQENWKETHERAYMDRPLILPPEAKRMVLAAKLNPQEDFASAWELGVMDLSESLSLKSIARAEGGYVDQLGSLPAAWVPSDAYFVELGPTTLGVMHPADRQTVSRWADTASRSSSVALSPYLKQAASAATPGTQIVMALDLRDAIQPHRLRDRLGENQPEALKGKNVDVAQLTEAVRSLYGITISVKVEDKFKGRLRVDFGQNISFMGPFAKPLLLEVLSEFGAKIEQLQSWKATVEPYAITMEGELSRDAMRRIFSLLELPSSKFSTVDQAAQDATGPEAVAKASKQYFGSVQVLVEDLHRTLDEGAANSTVWMDKYAKKIDRLPILHVDEELLAYGADVATRFRDMSVAKKSANVRGGVRKANTYGDYYYGYNDTAYSTGGLQHEFNRIRTEERAQATGVRINLWKAIEDDTATIRRSMTKKYMVEF